MINTVYLLIAITVGLVTGLILSLMYRTALKSQRNSIDDEKKKIVEGALKESESIKKEASIEAKDIIYQAKTEAEKELRERRSEFNHLEKRLRQKEESIERKFDQVIDFWGADEVGERQEVIVFFDPSHKPAML